MSYEGTDIYCDLILNGTLDVQRVYEDNDVLAFYHTNPYWPVHLIVIPKAHLPSLTDIGHCEPQLIYRVLDVVMQLTRDVERQYGAASVLTNVGDYQHSKHLHFHIYHGEPLR